MGRGKGTRWYRRNEVGNQDMAFPCFRKNKPSDLHRDPGPRPWVGAHHDIRPPCRSETGFLVGFGYAEENQNIP